MTILCSAVCSPSCNIQWKSWNGDNVGTGSLLSFVDVNKNRDGNYTCEASNKVGMRSQMSQIVVNCEFNFMFTNESAHYVLYIDIRIDHNTTLALR